MKYSSILWQIEYLQKIKSRYIANPVWYDSEMDPMISYK